MFSLIVAGALAASPRLVPPQWYYYNHVKALLGADPCVGISDLTQNADGHYGLNLDVCDLEKAKALNTVLKRGAPRLTADGTPLVTVQVAGPDHVAQPLHPNCAPATPQDVARLFQTALAGNRYVHNVAPDESASGVIWIEFAPEVIQVWVDNLGDRYGNVNYVAADAFKEVIGFANCGPTPAVRATSGKITH